MFNPLCGSPDPVQDSERAKFWGKNIVKVPEHFVR